VTFNILLDSELPQADGEGRLPLTSTPGLESLDPDALKAMNKGARTGSPTSSSR